MSGATRSTALRALIQIERRMRREDARAQEIARVAVDYERWGFVEDAEWLRGRGRSHRIACLRLSADAAAWALRLGGPAGPVLDR